MINQKARDPFSITFFDNHLIRALLMVSTRIPKKTRWNGEALLNTAEYKQIREESTINHHGSTIKNFKKIPWFFYVNSCYIAN